MLGKVGARSVLEGVFLFHPAFEWCPMGRLWQACIIMAPLKMQSALPASWGACFIQDLPWGLWEVGSCSLGSASWFTEHPLDSSLPQLRAMALGLSRQPLCISEAVTCLVRGHTESPAVLHLLCQTKLSSLQAKFWGISSDNGDAKLSFFLGFQPSCLPLPLNFFKKIFVLMHIWFRPYLILQGIIKYIFWICFGLYHPIFTGRWSKFSKVKWHMGSLVTHLMSQMAPGPIQTWSPSDTAHQIIPFAWSLPVASVEVQTSELSTS
jgi:hypothetical protein